MTQLDAPATIAVTTVIGAHSVVIRFVPKIF